MTSTDSTEHPALVDDPEAARFGPPTVYYLDRPDPATRAAGCLVAVLASLVLWFLLGLGLLLLLG